MTTIDAIKYELTYQLETKRAAGHEFDKAINAAAFVLLRGTGLDAAVMLLPGEVAQPYYGRIAEMAKLLAAFGTEFRQTMLDADPDMVGHNGSPDVVGCASSLASAARQLRAAADALEGK
jgi:hypothetical protein